MFNLDPAKLLVILVIGLIVIGPERLPRVARQLGAAWRTLSTYREQAESEIRKAIPDLDLPRIPTSPSVAVSTFLTSLTTSGQPLSTGTPSIATKESTAPSIESNHGCVDEAPEESAELAPFATRFGVRTPDVSDRADTPEMN